MICSHLGHSVLPICTAIGPPRVKPCRTPPSRVTTSCSNFIRAPAAVAEATTGQLPGDIGSGDRYTGRQSLQDGNEGRSV